MVVLLAWVTTALCAPEASSATVVSQASPQLRLKFDDGFVKWQDPFQVHTVSGAMAVDVYPDWIVVKTGDGKLHVVPRGEVLYVGTWHLDAER
ncbi:MAG: hypothetical protein ABMA64_18835 [Myxococcota bacterium]